jgi:hypothetical protein
MMTIGVDVEELIRFEKGDPVSGSEYICDRCFVPEKVENLFQEDGLYVCPRCHNLDLMAETGLAIE